MCGGGNQNGPQGFQNANSNIFTTMQAPSLNQLAFSYKCVRNFFGRNLNHILELITCSGPPPLSVCVSVFGDIMNSPNNWTDGSHVGSPNFVATEFAADFDSFLLYYFIDSIL